MKLNAEVVNDIAEVLASLQLLYINQGFRACQMTLWRPRFGYVGLEWDANNREYYVNV